MKPVKLLLAAAIAVLMSGCASYGTLVARPTPDQTASYEDGHQTLISMQTNKLVLAPSRPILTDEDNMLYLSVVVKNNTTQPFVFSADDIHAWYLDEDGDRDTVDVYSYTDLVMAELDARQSARIAAAFSGLLSGLMFSGGHVGDVSYSGAGFSPGAAVMTSNRLASQANYRSRTHLRSLANSMLKKQTVQPGQWYGGVVQMHGPDVESAPHNLHFTIKVGNETHRVIFSEQPLDDDDADDLND